MKNKCIISCAIASAFFSGMLYFSLNPYKYNVLKDFLNTLNQEQLTIFNKIHKERMQIYLVGLVIGLLLGFIFLQNNNHNKYNTCVFVSIVMGVNYLFYMIYPKSTYMLQHLKTQEQINTWQTVYKYMQYYHYTGMILGLISYVIVSII